MAELSQFEYDNVVYDLKDAISRSVIDVITDVLVDALENHVKGYEGVSHKTVSGSIVTFTIPDVNY